jgi:hypothetical protein
MNTLNNKAEQTWTVNLDNILSHKTYPTIFQRIKIIHSRLSDLSGNKVKSIIEIHRNPPKIGK